MSSENSERGGIGVFICSCGLNIGGTIDIEAVKRYAETLDGVVYADTNMYSCSDPGQDAIKQAIKDHGIRKAVVALAAQDLIFQSS